MIELTDDFTRRGKFRDLGRWYVSRFVSGVARQIPEGAIVLDAGAGECAYKHLFGHTRYRSVDLAVGDSNWNYMNLDCLGRMNQLPFHSNSIDAVVCTQVLEHLARPEECLKEIHRVLRPGGRAYFTVPMSQGEHQTPHDFFRYTSYGLDFLATAAGFARRTIEPMGGIFTRWAWELPLALEFIPGTGLGAGKPSMAGIVLLPVRIVGTLVIRGLQRLLIAADGLDKKRLHPLGWSMIAAKEETDSRRNTR